MKNRIKEYLKDKGVKIDESFLKYLDNGIKISEKDEYMHDWGIFPDNHNESWYFNAIDLENDFYFITRISFVMDRNLSQIMMIIGIEGKVHTYFKEIKLEKMPNNWEFDKKIKYYCVKAFDEWRITYEDRKISLNINLKGRFPVHNSLEDEDPIETLEKYGIKLLDVTAQQHYEQPMKATGTLKLKKSSKIKNIKCHGQRDHSWGTRDWVNIDNWNWGAAQFDDETINLWRSQVFGKSIENGTIFTEDKNIKIIGVEVETETEDGKKPISSTFIITDENGNKRKLVSESVYSLHFPVPTKDNSSGYSEIYEQIVKYKCEGKQGSGVSEYMISNR